MMPPLQSRFKETLTIGTLFHPSRLHIIFTLFLVEFAFFFSCSVLVLLVLRDKVVHVALGFSELHLVHSFTSVSVEESFATEHGCEVLGNALEHFLNGGGVSSEGNSHLQALWWNVADACLDVV